MIQLKAKQIRANVEEVNLIIEAACAKAGRSSSDVVLVAVSKKKPVADILAAAEAGAQHFGENRVEEAMEKIPKVNQEVVNPLSWHMVGHIQSRKARHIHSLFQMVHSVDSIKLAEKLANLAQDAGQSLDVLVQVNVSGEVQKYGFNASDWERTSQVKERLFQDFSRIAQLPGLRVCGLMTMAPIVENMEDTRPVFASLAALKDELSAVLQVELPHLSMGMTDDYPVAVEEGATIVRVGRAIFGERHTP